jgi:hypothetical protein
MTCPKCGVMLNRRTDAQLSFMCVFFSAFPFGAFLLDSSMAVQIGAALVGIAIVWLFDVMTVRLVVAGPRKGIAGYDV